MNKNFKIFGIRQSLLGDSIMALPILNFLEKKYPGSYKYWQIARKNSGVAQMYLNHPLIDKIVVSDCEEGMGSKDIEIASKCDLVFNTMPSHPFGDNWPNQRNIFEETWVMAGLRLEDFHAMSLDEQRPKLYKWFKEEPRVFQQKYIAIFPQAGYARENSRNPGKQWYIELITKLNRLNIGVVQYGHPKDWNFTGEIPSNDLYQRKNDLDFFFQIKESLSSDLAVVTDSGSGLIMGAYEHPTISLINFHWPGHNQNPFAFATNGKNNTNFFGEGGCDNISIDKVVAKIVELSS